jgi:hypothetical protein
MNVFYMHQTPALRKVCNLTIVLPSFTYQINTIKWSDRISKFSHPPLPAHIPQRLILFWEKLSWTFMWKNTLWFHRNVLFHVFFSLFVGSPAVFFPPRKYEFPPQTNHLLFLLETPCVFKHIFLGRVIIFSWICFLKKTICSLFLDWVPLSRSGPKKIWTRGKVNKYDLHLKLYNFLITYFYYTKSKWVYLSHYKVTTTR